jgi:glycosyltransferase involved in cell wall biosynthesis
MNVLFVQRQPCIRTLKYAEGFRATNPEFEFSFAYENSTLTEFYGHGDERFAGWWKLGGDPASTLRDVVATQEIDLIHCHNGPDTLTNLCIDCFRGQVPIVHDIHDLMSARVTEYDDMRNEARPGGDPVAAEAEVALEVWQPEERRAIEESDAVIAVSNEILEIALGHGYDLPNTTAVYANYIPARFIPDELPVTPAWDESRPLRVVYEGSLNSDGGHYDLRGIFTAVASLGLEIHIYPSRAEPAYAELADTVPGIVYHRSLPPEQLYEELPHYDLGWAGFNDALNLAHLETVLPNKLFEYVACGLPVLSFRHRALTSFIEAHSVGLVIDRVAQIGEILDAKRMASLRQSVLAQRRDFTVEANIGLVADLYHRLTAQPSTVSGDLSHHGAR